MLVLIFNDLGVNNCGILREYCRDPQQMAREFCNAGAGMRTEKIADNCGFLRVAAGLISSIETMCK